MCNKGQALGYALWTDQLRNIQKVKLSMTKVLPGSKVIHDPY